MIAVAGPQRSSPRSGREGFTLVEIMIALIVLAFGALAVAGLSAVLIESNRGATNRTRADEALYQKVEEFQSIPYRSIANGSDTVSIGGVTFTRTWTIDPNTPVPNLLRLRLVAEWVEKGDTLRVRTTTLRGQS